MDIQQPVRLLQQVQEKIKHSKEISELKGENFNIFSVMSIERREVKTHSAFLAELLNPKGSHGLMDKFLILFIKILKKSLIKQEDVKSFTLIDQFNINTSNAFTVVEEHIGYLNGDKTKGGRIDIVVKDGTKIIVIENKIDASEGKNQLLRYKNQYPDAPILFLTLTGYDSVSANQLEKNKHYFLISYSREIIEWLNLCLKESVELPMLREAIKQYINLIKKMTGQLTNDKMSKEVVEIIATNLQSAKTIVDNFQSAKGIVLDEIRTILLDRLRVQFDKYLINVNNDINAKNSYIWMSYKEGSQKLFLGIEAFSGRSGVSSRLFMGILDLFELKKDYFEENYKGIETKSWWRGIRYFTKFDNYDIEFSNIEFLDYLQKSGRINDLVIHIQEEFVGYINEFEQIFIEISTLDDDAT